MRDRPDVSLYGEIRQDNKNKAFRKRPFSGKKEKKLFFSRLLHRNRFRYKSKNIFFCLFPRCNPFKRSESPVKISGNKKAQINTLILSPLLFIKRFFMNFLTFLSVCHIQKFFSLLKSHLAFRQNIPISNFLSSRYRI